jgi:hypothetical protein
MPNEFLYNVFLSHSAKDKAVVRARGEPTGTRLHGPDILIETRF